MGFGWNKFFGLGLDITVVCWIATRVLLQSSKKIKIKRFQLFIHCVVHRTNVASFDVASSGSSKSMSKMINKLVNDTATHFKNHLE